MSLTCVNLYTLYVTLYCVCQMCLCMSSCTSHVHDQYYIVHFVGCRLSLCALDFTVGLFPLAKLPRVTYVCMKHSCIVYPVWIH